jgi:hypothetical protein
MNSELNVNCNLLFCHKALCRYLLQRDNIWLKCTDNRDHPCYMFHLGLTIKTDLFLICIWSQFTIWNTTSSAGFLITWKSTLFIHFHSKKWTHKCSLPNQNVEHLLLRLILEVKMYLYFTAVSQKPLLLAKNIKVRTRQLFIHTLHLIILII